MIEIPSFIRKLFYFIEMNTRLPDSLLYSKVKVTGRLDALTPCFLPYILKHECEAECLQALFTSVLLSRQEGGRREYPNDVQVRINEELTRKPLTRPQTSFFTHTHQLP